MLLWLHCPPSSVYFDGSQLSVTFAFVFAFFFLYLFWLIMSYHFKTNLVSYTQFRHIIAQFRIPLTYYDTINWKDLETSCSVNTNIRQKKCVRPNVKDGCDTDTDRHRYSVLIILNFVLINLLYYNYYQIAFFVFSYLNEIGKNLICLRWNH